MSAIGAIGSYGSISGYYSVYQNRNANPTGAEPVSPVSRAQAAPVPPVGEVPAVRRGAAQQMIPEEKGFPLLREGADPAEMAVRARIRPFEDGEEANRLPGQAARKTGETPEGEEVKNAQEVMEDAECQTCKERKYQDGSDDPGVSFKTATNIAPEQVASAVRGHEQEHVVREQAKAQREDRRVVSQSVTLHTDICPECGKVYISGGTTRTTTKANPVEEVQQPEDEEKPSFQAIA